MHYVRTHAGQGHGRQAGQTWRSGLSTGTGRVRVGYGEGAGRARGGYGQGTGRVRGGHGDGMGRVRSTNTLPHGTSVVRMGQGP